MALQFGYRNRVFDNSLPLYIDVGAGMAFNRLSGQTTTMASLQAAMAADGYTAGQGEIGASSDWEDDNLGWWTFSDSPAAGGGVQQPPYAPPTVTPTQGIPADGDQGGAAVIDIDFHSNNIPVGGLTATITYDIGGGDVVTTQALTAGDSPSAASADITAKLNGVTEFTAGKVGNTITVTPDAGVTIAKLVLAIA